MKNNTKVETVDLGSGIKIELPAFSKMTDEELQVEFDKALKNIDAEYAFALIEEGVRRETFPRGT